MIKNGAILVALLVLAIFSCAQAKRPSISTSTRQYASGVDRLYQDIKPIEDDPRRMRFHLHTSWIPGASGKGVFRYQLEASILPLDDGAIVFHKNTPPKYGWDPEVYLKIAHGCSYTLNIYDSGSYKLSSIDLVLHYGVDDNGKIVALQANDSFPMPLDDYRSFLSASNYLSWAVSWICQ